MRPVEWLAVVSRFSNARLGSVIAAQPQGRLASLTVNPTGQVPHEMILDIVNFLLLVIVLGYLLRKRVSAYFSGRSRAIRQEMEAARQALKEAKSRLAEATGKVALLEQEIRKLRDEALREMDLERERFRRETAQEAIKIQQLADAQLTAASRAAQAELRAFAAREVVGKAEQAIRRRLDYGGQHRLISSFLADLRSKASRN